MVGRSIPWLVLGFLLGLTIAPWASAQNTVFRYQDANNDLIADGAPLSGHTTIQAAVNAVTLAGGSEIVETQNAGPVTYTEKVTVSGKATTAANRLTIRKRAGDPETTVTPPSSGPAGGRTASFYVTGVNFVRIEGFTLANSTGAGGQNASIGGMIFEDSTDNILTGCISRNHSAAGVISLKTTAGSVAANTLIENCTFHTNGTNGIQITRHRNVTIRNCTIHSNTALGIQIFDDADSALIESCTIRNNSNAGVHLTTNVDGVTIQDSTIHTNVTAGILFETGSGGTCSVLRNTIRNNQTFGIYFNDLNSSAASAVVRHNVVFGHTQEIRFNDTGGSTIANNSIYHTSTAANNAGILFEGNGGLSTGNTVKNNVVWAVGSGAANSSRCVWPLNNEAGTYDYNNLYATAGADVGGTGYNGTSGPSVNHTTLASWQGTGRDANSISLDPRFVSVAAGSEDFSLRSTFGRWNGATWVLDSLDSPSIDAGDPADAVGSETAAHGGRINQGSQGGRATASRSGEPNFDFTWTGKTALWGTASASWTDGNNWTPRGSTPGAGNTVFVPKRTFQTGPGGAFLDPLISTDVTAGGVTVGVTTNTYDPGDASNVATVTVGSGAAGTLTVSGTLSTLKVGATGDGRVLVKPGRTLTLSRAKATWPPDQHPIDGTLELETNAAGSPTLVRLGDHQQLVVSGTLRTTHLGTPSFAAGDYVRFERTGAAGTGYSVHMKTGSTLFAGFVRFEDLYGSSGNSNEYSEATVESAFAISSGAAGIQWFNAIWFTGLADGGGESSGRRHNRYLYLLGDTNGDRTTTENSFNGLGDLTRFMRVRFEGSTNLGGLDAYNVEKAAPGDVVTFINGVGAVHGQQWDLDGDSADYAPPQPTPGYDDGIDDIDFGAQPTAVDLADLSARGFDRAVLVEWQTGQEVDNLGFNVYRRRSPEDGWIRIHEAMILGLGDSQTGGRYWFLDRTVENGVRYWYRLEDVDVRGERSLHGPVEATPSRESGEVSIDLEAYVNGVSTGTAALAGPAPGAAAPGPGAPARRPGGVSEVLLGVDLEAAGIRLLDLGPTWAVLEIRPPAPTLTPEVWDGVLQTRIEMAGYGTTRVAGRPAVPARTVLLVTPWIGSATATILEADSRRLEPIDPVRARPAAARSLSPLAPPGPGGASSFEDVMDMIRDSRRELLARIAADREALLAARREALRRLSGKGGGGPGEPDRPLGGANPVPDGGPFPGRLVGLGDLATYGGRQLLPIEIHPVQVAGSRADVYRRIFVRIEFAGEAPPPAEPPAGTATRLALAADGSALKVHVDRDGVHRLTRADLAAAGFDVGSDPRTWRMHEQGLEVAIRIEGEIDGAFDDDDALLFYGRRNPWRLPHHPEATRYTDRNVYWLSKGSSAGRRMEEVWVRPVEGASPAIDHAAVRHVEDDSLYYPRLEDGEGRDHWFGATRLYNAAGGSHPLSSQTIAVPTPWLSTRPHTARLSISLAGVTEFEVDPDHHVVVSVGGVVVGEARWDGRRAHRRTFEFPSSTLRAGDNLIELRVPAGVSGASADLVLVDYVRLEYRRRFRAESDELAFRGDAAGAYAASGFGDSSVRAIDRSDPVAPRFLRGLAAAGGEVRFDDRAVRTGGDYLLAGESAVRRPVALEANRPSAWHAAAADWIAIAHPSLLAEVGPLADLRTSQGLRAAVVDVTDVYDEFTGGVPDPVAIRSFLARVRPRFCLLVGDGSIDSHGRLHPGSDLVPAPMVQMDLLWSASDNWYAALDGDDHLPDLAIGRLPASTPDEVARTVAKILAREAAPAAPWRARATLVADDADATYDFGRAVSEVAPLFGPAYEVETLLLGRESAATIRRRIAAAFADGRTLVGYVGHGDTVRWASESLLVADSVGSLGNDGRYGLVTAMGCMNGMFHLPGTESLGEVLIEADRAGAMAFWGSTTLAEPAGQEATYRELVRILFAEGGRTIGEAIDEAKVRAWGDGFDRSDVVRSWVLLGDPASRLSD